jgi:hypothetical protein
MLKPGRPRALDEVKQREVLALISHGCGIETAANYVGCSARTIHRETRRNKEFWDRFRKAELAATLSPLQTVQRAAHENWRAATWLLERKLPQNFAPTHRSMIDPNDLGKILDRFFDEVNRSIPDRQMRDRILRRIQLATVTAVHESTTTRKNPKIRPRRSSLRNLPFDPAENLQQPYATASTEAERPPEEPAPPSTLDPANPKLH